MADMKIPAPFDPEEFRKKGHQMVDILSDYLHEAVTGSEMQVLPWNEPDRLVEMFALDPETGGNEPFDDFIRKIIKYSNHLHHPHYIGHQVTSPLPLTALVQFCTTLLNNGAAVYEMGPVSMAMEKNVIKSFAGMIGYGAGFDGIFTHGGTAGNLTAMLAARQSKTDYNIWEEGISDKPRPAFMISEQAHYSIGRNVRIMGLGSDSAVRVPVDKNYRMRTDLLEEIMAGSEKNGIRIICVVASACSTATGTYDDLKAVADFCSRHNLWMHVDGAHGMGVLFSEKYRHLVSGIERADSVVIDFHKMFLVPALNTLVMFRESDRSFETFAQKASYLFHKQKENPWYDSAIRTIECTKSSLGTIAYAAMKYYGKSYYREYIESRYGLASVFAGMIRSSETLELATEPQSNIICFRFKAAGTSEEKLNRINAVIRDRIMKEGSFYIVRVELNGTIWLRTTIINPVTSLKDLEELLFRINEIGNSELA